MRVFVAGGTGAIGRPLVRQLLVAGHDVTAMTRSEEGAAALRAAGAIPVVWRRLRPQELGWVPRYASWRQGFREALG